MMLRLTASIAPVFPLGRHALRPTLPAVTMKSAIRLSFQGYRLSLPIPSASVENHDQKIA
ncbi:hypothetical protein RFM41_28980 [Mesorhizobium sp. VK25A]|uniref:Uncharacterized protein n=2 Tax=Mesorhizobium vachelliae TaxID=3072309 RepID=A0ABU5A7P5_9HYPH|nr:hypothetical protein [Mesorhizobium sp. VK25A]MDX8532539.1 hypothetical protein [Mesorhizobium sp. VK25D]MDX8547815.1 hypothetical protein [Mesorhizobium sp. VK25A]